MSKLSDIPKLKERFKTNNFQKERISKDCFLRAKANVETMKINTEADAFLFFTSLNLFNAYIKNHRKELSYAFKNDVITGFEKIIDNNIPNSTFCYDSNEHVTIVNISGLQFSFHSVKPSEKMQAEEKLALEGKSSFYKQQEWEGVRLQPVAETLFHFSNHLEDLSNESTMGNLQEYQNACVENYYLEQCQQQ